MSGSSGSLTFPNWHPWAVACCFWPDLKHEETLFLGSSLKIIILQCGPLPRSWNSADIRPKDSRPSGLSQGTATCAPVRVRLELPSVQPTSATALFCVHWYIILSLSKCYFVFILYGVWCHVCACGGMQSQKSSSIALCLCFETGFHWAWTSLLWLD